MYRRPKFLEVLLDIRKEMAAAAGYDVKNLVESVLDVNEEILPAHPTAGSERQAVACQETEEIETPSRA